MSDTGGPQDAGWKPDPDGRHEYRYWDGTTWSDQVSDGGVVSTDPPGAPPSPVVPPTTVDQPPVVQQPPMVPQPTEPTAPAAGVPGVDLGGPPPAQRSGLPVGVLALIGLVVAALVVGGVLLLTGGDDGGSSDEASVSTDEDDLTDDLSEDITDDASDDASDELTDDLSDESDPFSDDFTSDFSDDVTEDSTGDPTGQVSANDLDVGDCVLDQATLTGTDVEAIDCAERHVFELYARFDVPDGPFDNGQLQTQGQRCTAAPFEDYIGVPYQESEIYASPILPSRETWAVGDRTVLCFAHTQALSPTTGSVEGANR